MTIKNLKTSTWHKNQFRSVQWTPQISRSLKKISLKKLKRRKETIFKLNNSFEYNDLHSFVVKLLAKEIQFLIFSNLILLNSVLHLDSCGTRYEWHLASTIGVTRTLRQSLAMWSHRRLAYSAVYRPWVWTFLCSNWMNECNSMTSFDRFVCPTDMVSNCISKFSIF